ncbi:MAG TPA: thiamine-phosphate kinase [Alphaproteobacteria bacterium]|nr:thiamine-phosphate kinase [Alphaproteobacteria bacterium]
MPPKRSGEFELIARYFAPLAARVPGAFGLTDDAAFLEVPDGQQLVAKTDSVVATVHFLPDDPPDLIARKVLRRNLSDLAAKGAVPRWYLLDAAFPKHVGNSWVARFAKGLAHDQAEFDVFLVGGDTKATPGPATFAITLLGVVRPGQGLRRNGARAGEDVYVTGTVGDAALGLLARRGRLRSLKPKQRNYLIGRYRLPQPRVRLGPQLHGLATAAIDISDGLVADLGHVCETSKLAAVIDETLLPLSTAAKAALAARPQLIVPVLTGGDDYEILFTAPPAAGPAIARLADASGVPMTRIGRMEAGQGVSVLDAQGRQRKLAQGGWTHF